MRKKQVQFAYMVGELLNWCKLNGYEVTFGEAYRTLEQAALNARSGKGIARSLHTDRLAVDLNLFINGEYQTATEAYRPLGEFWESIGGSWGGRFNDGNHFSLPYGGRR